MHTPLIRITLSFIAGILLGRVFLHVPLTTIALISSALIASVSVLIISRSGVRVPLTMLLACLAGTLSLVYSAAYLPPDHYLRGLEFDGAKHGLTGRIVSPLERDPDRTAFILELQGLDSRACSGRVRVSVRDAEPPAGYGDSVRIIGRLYEPRGFQNPGGFDYAEHLARQGTYATASVRSFGDVAVLHRSPGIFRTIQDWRERIRRNFLAATTGPGSAILQAMVLGEEGGLTDEVRDTFMSAGVTHILSISGSHLGLVALACFGLLRWLLFLLPERSYLRLTLLADPKKIAALCTLFPVVFYAFLAGGQVATLRSLVMILAALAAVLLDRENGLMRSLAAAALAILIISPQALFDISFQLSYLSVLCIGYVVSVWSELALPAEGRLRKIGKSVLLLVVVSLTASLATGPLVAYYFNQVSPAGIVSNLIVVPFAGFVVVPVGLVSGVLSLALGRLPFPALNQAVADGFYGLVSFFARFPLTEFHPPSPGMLSLVAFGIFFISAAQFVRTRLLSALKPLESSQRFPRMPLIAMTLSGMVLLVSVAALFLPENSTRITFLDVGQGDCALVELPSGKDILIDAGGTRDNRFDMGRRVVAPYLWDRNISRLDLVILSHPHPDHMNGLFFLVKKFAVREFWDSGRDGDLDGYGALQREITDRRIPVRTMPAGRRVHLGDDAELTVLHPRTEFASRSRKAYEAENNRSLVVRMDVDGRTILFTGDIGVEAEKDIIRTVGNLKCDLLKVPHHGSRSSSSDVFLSRIKPEAAVIPVGKGNLYHHPSPEVVERYEQSGIRLFRTDRDGAVIVTLDNKGMHISPWAERILRRISLDEMGNWPGVERENWKKLWGRIRDS